MLHTKFVDIWGLTSNWTDNLCCSWQHWWLGIIGSCD